MSTVRLPSIIDPASMQHGLNQAESIIPLKSFERLCSIAENHDTSIKVSLSWGIDPGGQALIQGELSCAFMLQCQRCLTPFEMPVKREFSLKLEFKRSQLQADEFSRLDEDKLLLDVGETVNVLDLVEDEMILSLPMHIKHEAISDCDPNMLNRATEYEAGSETKKESPFEVLKNLKTLE